MMNYDGEEAVVSGGLLLESNWKNSAENIWELDLSGYDIKEISGLRIGRRRAVRARYPNGCTSNEPLPSKYLCQG